MAQLGAGLENGGICYAHGSVYCTGWDANKVKFCASSEADLEREILDGTNYLLDVCNYTPGVGEDPPRSWPERADDGAVVVVVDGGGDMTSYLCRNFVDGFAPI